MNQALLKKAAIQSVALMLAVITLSFAIGHYRTITISASNIINEAEDNVDAADSDRLTAPVGGSSLGSQTQEDEGKQKPSDLNLSDKEKLLQDSEDTILGMLGDKFLLIEKPEGSNQSISLEDLYVNKSIKLTLKGMTQRDMDSRMINRVKGEELFRGDPIYTETVTVKVDEEEGTSEEVIIKDYGNDLSHGITVTVQKDSIGELYTADILIKLDNVYAHILYEDANYYYIDLRKPSEVYDKIVVIDPGHGGKDVGAISRDKKFYEKNINVDIARKLKVLLDKENIKVYYTRTDDSTVFLRPRVELANSVDADYFISIHCNSNELTSPNGLEVLYYDTEFKGVKGLELARLFSKELGETITLRQRGVIQKHMEDIFIMDKATVPMILIEVAYMSNKKDMDYLNLEKNREAVAQGIYNGIIKAYAELPVTR